MANSPLFLVPSSVPRAFCCNRQFPQAKSRRGTNPSGGQSDGNSCTRPRPISRCYAICKSLRARITGAQNGGSKRSLARKSLTSSRGFSRVFCARQEDHNRHHRASCLASWLSAEEFITTEPWEPRSTPVSNFAHASRNSARIISATRCTQKDTRNLSRIALIAFERAFVLSCLSAGNPRVGARASGRVKILRARNGVGTTALIGKSLASKTVFSQARTSTLPLNHLICPENLSQRAHHVLKTSSLCLL